MSIRLSTLLYSDYSLHCSRLLKLLEDCPVDFQALTSLKIINIDNKKVRQQIKDSKIIQVRMVPCILVVYTDGGVEKFESGEAFNWVNGIINATTPVVQPQPIQSLPITPLPQPPAQPSIQQPPASSAESAPQFVAVDAPPMATSIDSLGDEPVETLQQEMIPVGGETVGIQRPKAGLIASSGSYEIQEFGEEIPVDRATTKGINKDKGSKKDVVSMAQAMQKAREAEFEKNKPKGLP